MIPALLAAGIGGLFVGTYLGIAGMALCAANRCGKLRASRDRWRRRALRLEQWVPQEVVADILVTEDAA